MQIFVFLMLAIVGISCITPLTKVGCLKKTRLFRSVQGVEGCLSGSRNKACIRFQLLFRIFFETSDEAEREMYARDLLDEDMEEV